MFTYLLDGHLDFHTAPEFVRSVLLYVHTVNMVLNVHRNRKAY